jgi:hypothetical protein
MSRPRGGTRLSALLAGTLTAVSLSLACFAAPAGAKVVGVATGSGTTAVGLQPRNATSVLDGGSGSDFENPTANPVLHGTQASGGIETYAIYWDPTDHFHGDWQHLVNTFLHNMGAEGGAFSNVFAVDTQYSDGTNTPAASRSTFRGAYTDTNAYPTPGCTDPQPLEPGDAITCLTDKQIRTELSSFIAAHGLQTGMGSIFYLLTPPGVTVCVDEGGAASHCSSNTASANSFCSYHSVINPDLAINGDGSTILYADIPWVAGGLGDYHLHPGSRNTEAYACQDGGFDPSTKPVAELKEKAKEKNEAEKEAFTKMDAEEKAVVLEAEALEGPRVQEPNQHGIGPDGAPDTGLADVLVNQIAVEQQNTVTDPLLDAWQGHDATHDEVTDECRNFFDVGGLNGASGANQETDAGTLSDQALSGASYYINTSFNLAALKLPFPAIPCLDGINLQPDFTSPNPVNVNEIVGFDGMESNISLNAADSFGPGGVVTNTYAKYTWDFGDETAPVTGFAPGAPACTIPWLTPCAASVFHSFQYGGEYHVKLTVTDVGGNVSSETHTVVVNGPAKPAPPAPPPPAATSGSGSSSAASPTGTSGAANTTAPAAAPTPAPVATAAVASTSLKTVLKTGLAVRYSVNEQVTGHFEVLLAASIAKRIGLHGSQASGLPKGAAPQLVIAKAILVTTKGGRSTIKILFGKKTAKLLKRLPKVSLMVRLVVRNGSATSPTSTVVSVVTLTH